MTVLLGVWRTMWPWSLDSRLFKAVAKGELQRVEALITRGANPNAGKGEATPLVMASALGNLALVKVLIENGADVNARSRNGCPALLAAAQMVQTAVAKLLLKHGADPNAQATDGATALHLAAQSGDVETAQTLLDSGAVPNVAARSSNTPLLLAAQQGHAATVRLLIQRGADPNSRTKQRTTPLMHAAGSGHCDVLQELLDHGADVNARANLGITALMYAVWHNQLNCAEMLLARGADVNAVGDIGLVIGGTAIRDPSPEHDRLAARVFQAGGAASCRTALQLSIALGNARMVEVLRRAGAQVSEREAARMFRGLVHTAATLGELDRSIEQTPEQRIPETVNRIESLTHEITKEGAAIDVEALNKVYPELGTMFSEKFLKAWVLFEQLLPGRRVLTVKDRKVLHRSRARQFWQLATDADEAKAEQVDSLQAEWIEWFTSRLKEINAALEQNI